LALFLKVPIPMTYAVLPGLPYSVQCARQARSRGMEILLHQPMEALGNYDEGPGVVLTSMDKQAISLQVEQNLQELGFVVGANNHMGSKGTQERDVLEPLLRKLKQQNLFFLDSRTSPDTIAASIAKELGVPYMDRDVFLDNSKDPVAIRKALAEGLAIADKKGYAIMIGHVWTAELAQVLLEEYRPLIDMGYSFDTLASLILAPPKGGVR
jgi:polysaccharide deacetylase 2 family uncharacterized protein YibQ